MQPIIRCIPIIKIAQHKHILEQELYFRFAFAIDGMLVRFDGAPRGIPRGPGLANLQNYWTRVVEPELKLKEKIGTLKKTKLLT